MNLILFESPEDLVLGIDDPRAQHIVKILKIGLGERFDMGIIDGPRGKAKIVSIDDGELKLSFELADNIPRLHPVHLICSYTRPAAAGRILREMTTLGLQSMSFFVADKAEKSYAKSKIWQNGEYRRFLVEGAEQAFCTQLPEVRLCITLQECIERFDGEKGIALDNYESSATLGEIGSQKSAVFAIGPERGWSGMERSLFRQKGFELADLGARVLRSDTACIAAASVLISKLEKQ